MNALARLLADPPDLPVAAALPRLRAHLAPEAPQPGTLKVEAPQPGTPEAEAPQPGPGTTPGAGSREGRAAAPALVVTAPPGSGKTTLLPPLVAEACPGTRGQAPGRVVVTQPRRVAARAAARRLARLLGEEVGGTVGYAVRGQRRTSPATRVEVVTTGVLLRRLQADPGLDGVGAVVLDEVHERSLEADLLLALLVDARTALREDLTVVAMSATLDAERLSGLLDAPVAEIPGTLHPVSEVWAPPPGRGARLGPDGVARDMLQHVAATTARAVTDHDGDVLVFLPGAREVDDVAARLRRVLPAQQPTGPATRPAAEPPTGPATEPPGGAPSRPGTGPAGDVEVLTLHASLPAAQQDAVLAGAAPGRRRVVVSTSVAESSLTVPGVRVVVDSTLAREPRLDVARSMSGLVTVGASRSALVQRAGRAGREGPGAVYRCCSATDWAQAPLAPTPEILTADLTRTALELAVWGVPDGAGLAWTDPPPAPALDAARSTLESLGLTRDGQVTPLGRAVAAVPAEVRPARALLAAAPALGGRRAAEATALLTAGLRAPGADLTTLARAVREGGTLARAWRTEARRLEKALPHGALLAGQDGPGESPGGGPVRGPGGRPDSGSGGGPGSDSGGPGGSPDDGPDGGPSGRASGGSVRDPGGGQGGDSGSPGTEPGAFLDHALGTALALAPEGTTGTEGAVAVVAGLAQPQWVARRRGGAPPPGHRAHYQTVAGTGVVLPAGSPLEGSPWLAVAEVDWSPGRGDALVRAAAPLSEELAHYLARPWEATEERTVWREGTLHAERVRRLGAITLSTTPAPAPGPTAAAEAVVALVRREGLGVLPWEGAARSLRARLALLHEHLGQPWPDTAEAALLERAEEWLAPQAAATQATHGRLTLSRLDTTAALRRLLPWPEASRLDELVPERLEVPSGSRVQVDYTQERPVLAVRVQECLGWTASPRVVQGRVAVVLHLLSPARRPVAVTDDLESFWRQGYPQVRAEMRGRYPRHSWPEDPWNAEPTRGTGRNRRQ